MPLNTIMLVDDEPRLLSGLRRRLSPDFEVITFERGAEAVDYLSAPNNVKVIVADMQMPEMNGIELLKTVSDIAPEVRRLMLTGNSDQETAMSAINEGKVFRFIRKPCETSELKAVINQAIDDYEFHKMDFERLATTPQTQSKYVDVQKNFLSVISDELRTPLSQIVTMSEVINRDAIKLDPEKLSGFLGQMNKSGLSALRQVDRILEYTRLQSDNSEDLSNAHCDIVDVINQAIKSAEQNATEKLVTFSVESLRKAAHIIAPRRSIDLMIKELIDNAVKFSQFGSHVGVIIKYDKERLAVRISNDGPSIFSDDKTSSESHETTPFQMQNMELAREKSGLGLGLSLVNAIAQKYDIGIDLQASNGQGAAAILIFKRSPAIALAAAAKTAKMSEDTETAMTSKFSAA